MNAQRDFPSGQVAAWSGLLAIAVFSLVGSAVGWALGHVGVGGWLAVPACIVAGYLASRAALSWLYGRYDRSGSSAT